MWGEVVAAPGPPDTASPTGLAVAVARAAGGAKRDRSLDVAARAHLRALARSFEVARRSALERLLERQGDAVARLEPHALVGGDAAARRASLLAFARDHGRSAGFTHFGLAHDDRGAVLLAARRVMTLGPLVAANRAHILRGRASAGAEVEAWRRGPCARRRRCAALPERVPVERQGRVVRVRFPTPAAGLWTLELLVDVGAGPEVAFLRHVRGLAAREGPSSSRRLDEAPTVERREVDDLETWLARLRRGAGRAPVTRHPALERAAAAHARAVCEAGWAVHRLPGGGGPAARARAAGFEGRITESVALASARADARHNLEASPAHLAGLLAPWATSAGWAEARAGRRRCLVIVLGARAGAESTGARSPSRSSQG
jgi:uncharacterized protein YkwD